MRGISHVTFVVADLERTARLLCEGLGAREVYDSAGREHSLSREKFFLLGDLWLVAMQGEPLAGRSYRHVAFAVDAADLPGCLHRLRALGVEVLAGRSRIEGEGASIYFHDDDNHLFELHAGTLEDRLAAYAAADAGQAPDGPR
ncbi:FosX/FosE/FosI family fosfomycin resistance hydrolase [Pseudoxanthomonas sp. 10H]|uniref:FosX/FosE/FosI family fosfomycin resistance hydrolase n=1 Tax=Pseudoxanthomonas sp. 10H TaxID=3242729 RepID=UPI00355779D2